MSYAISDRRPPAPEWMNDPIAKHMDSLQAARHMDARRTLQRMHERAMAERIEAAYAAHAAAMAAQRRAQ